MIYVDQKQLDQVEYLIEQSAKGYHILFDNNTIRKAFKNSKDETNEPTNKKEDNETEKHIENLILQPTLLAKRAYLEKLDSAIFDKVVRSYFSIVENNVSESMKYDQ